MITRIAPSPSGYLHIGNASSFLLAWLDMRQRGGQVLMRIEDLDPQRSKVTYAEAALEDLSWLGLDWDGDVVYQSARHDLYEAALDTLKSKGLVFSCRCSRQDIAEAVRAAGDVSGYPGTCQDAGHDLGGGAMRIRWEQDMFVLRRADGAWAYQLAVVVDDADQGVTDVIRGNDLVQSIAPQTFLHSQLGTPIPQYWHLPLWMGPDGHRLGKRHGAVALRDFRAKGWTSEQILGLIAHGLGLIDQPIAVTMDDLLAKSVREHVFPETVSYAQMIPLWP